MHRHRDQGDNETARLEALLAIQGPVPTSFLHELQQHCSHAQQSRLIVMSGMAVRTFFAD